MWTYRPMVKPPAGGSRVRPPIGGYQDDATGVGTGVPAPVPSYMNPPVPSAPAMEALGKGMSGAFQGSGGQARYTPGANITPPAAPGAAPGIPYSGGPSLGGTASILNSPQKDFSVAPAAPGDVSIRPGMPMGYYPMRSPAQTGFQGNAYMQYQPAGAGQQPLQSMTPHPLNSGVGFQSEQEMVNQYRDDQRIAGSGPYDSGEGRRRWQTLRPQPNNYQNDVNARIEAYRQGKRGDELYPDGNRGPRASIDNRSPEERNIAENNPVEMERRRRAAAEKYRNKAAARAENRRNLAIDRHGLNLAPTYNYTPDPRQATASSESPSVYSNKKLDETIANNTVTENGKNTVQWGGVVSEMFQNAPDNPQAAADALKKKGVRTDQIREALRTATTPEERAYAQALLDIMTGQKTENPPGTSSESVASGINRGISPATREHPLAKPGARPMSDTAPQDMVGRLGRAMGFKDAPYYPRPRLGWDPEFTGGQTSGKKPPKTVRPKGGRSNYRPNF